MRDERLHDIVLHPVEVWPDRKSFLTASEKHNSGPLTREGAELEVQRQRTWHLHWRSISSHTLHSSILDSRQRIQLALVQLSLPFPSLPNPDSYDDGLPSNSRPLRPSYLHKLQFRSMPPFAAQKCLQGQSQLAIKTCQESASLRPCCLSADAESTDALRTHKHHNGEAGPRA